MCITPLRPPDGMLAAVMMAAALWNAREDVDQVRVQPRVNSPAYSQSPLGHGQQKDHERPREDMEFRFLLRKLNITA